MWHHICIATDLFFSDYKHTASNRQINVTGTNKFFPGVPAESAIIITLGSGKLSYGQETMNGVILPIILMGVRAVSKVSGNGTIF